MTRLRYLTILFLLLGLLAPHPSGAVTTPNPFHLLKTIHLPGDGGWDYFTLDDASRRLYITRGTHVMVVNPDTAALIGGMTGFKGIHGVAIDHKGGRGFISDGKANSVAVFGIWSLKVTRHIPVGNGPDAIVFDPATSRVFTFNGEDNSSTVIDATTLKVIGTIPLPGRPEFAVADGKGHIYENIEDKSEVIVIDTRKLKVTATWPLAPAVGPSGIAMDTRTHRLFCVCRNELMAVVNADNGKIMGTFPIGKGPDAAAFDESSQFAFSSNGRDGTVSVYKQQPRDKYAFFQTIPTMLGARTMVFDNVTKRVITVTAQTLPPAPGDPPRKRRFGPGTFVVLEYGR